MKQGFYAAAMILVVFSLASPVLAQTSPKIAAVDTQKALEESIWGKKAITEMENERENWRQRVSGLDKEVADLEEKLAKQRAFLDDKNKEKELTDEIERKKQGRDLVVQQGNASLADKQQKLLDPILAEMKNVIKKLAMKEGYDIVLEKRLIVLYINPEFDITSKVTVMLDDVYKSRNSSKAAEATKDAASKTSESKKGSK